MRDILETIEKRLPSLKEGDKLIIERDGEEFHAYMVFHEVVKQTIATSIRQNK